MDAVMADISDLKTRVGASDRIRLEQHFDGIRAIEKQLAKAKELEAAGTPRAQLSRALALQSGAKATTFVKYMIDEKPAPKKAAKKAKKEKKGKGGRNMDRNGWASSRFV